MNPLSLFNAWLSRKRAARLVATAEHRRAAIIAQRQSRKAKHRAWRFLDGELMRSTNESLAASTGRTWRANP